MSSREAAEVLGVSHTTVERDTTGTNVPDKAPTPRVTATDVGTNVPSESETNGVAHDNERTTADPYPFMQSWKPYHVAEAGEAAGGSLPRPPSSARETQMTQAPSSSSSAEAAAKSRVYMEPLLR